MLRSCKKLRKFKIRARDGDLGSLHDFYFDDELWMVRFYVVETGTWLTGRKVLISPVSAGEADMHEQVIPVDLSMEQVKHSPDVSTEHPVSRQSVEGLYAYYGWAFPWEAAVYMAAPPVPDPALELETPPADPHLHSVKDLIGQWVEAPDGRVGVVEDFLIDDEDVRLRYLVIDTSSYLPGQHAIISPEWIREMKSTAQTIYTDLRKSEIAASPQYTPDEELNREKEASLFAHYSRNPYW